MRWSLHDWNQCLKKEALKKKKVCVREGLEKKEPSHTVGGNANQYSRYGEQSGDFLKNWKQDCHTTQQSHCWAFTLRKPELKETHVLQCSLRHCLQQLGHGSNLEVANKWIRYLWYIYTVEYYSAIKKNTFESVLMRWMKLEPIIQSEVSQRNTNTVYWRIYMEFRKMVMTTLYAKQQKRHRCKEQTFELCGRRRGWDDLREYH